MTQLISINVEQILEISSKFWLNLLCLYVPVPWVASCFLFGRCWVQISARRPSKLTELLYEFPQVLHEIQWAMLQRTMLQRTNDATNSICQNQDAKTNTDATTNAEEYYRPT